MVSKKTLIGTALAVLMAGSAQAEPVELNCRFKAQYSSGASTYISVMAKIDREKQTVTWGQADLQIVTETTEVLYAAGVHRDAPRQLYTFSVKKRGDGSFGEMMVTQVSPYHHSSSPFVTSENQGYCRK